MLGQLLIGASLAAAAYRDVKERAVSDLVWVPALVGTALVVYGLYPDLALELVKVGLIGGIALAFAYLGLVGQADAIALAFIAADPYMSPPFLPLAFGAAVFAGHAVYLAATGYAWGTKTIPIEQFLKEQKWIPVATIAGGVRKEVGSDVNSARDEVEASQEAGSQVEVKYGVPTVAYLGTGYVAFLVFLLATSSGSLLSLF
jgi:hypothetical protein